jgi:hypothetical protein
MRCSGRIHGEREVFFQEQIRYGVAHRGCIKVAQTGIGTPLRGKSRGARYNPFGVVLFVWDVPRVRCATLGLVIQALRGSLRPEI